MFEETVTSTLIIVVTEKCRKYGAYLMQLISVKDDKKDHTVGPKDGSVKAVLWSEKDYQSNLPTLSSTAHILFIGNSKLINDETANMSVRFNDLGMKFLSLGRKAALFISEIISTKEQYDRFITLCSKYGKNIEKKAEFKEKNNLVVPKGILAGAASVGGVLIKAVKNVLSEVDYRKKERIKDQQYSFLVLYSYIELLNDFLEN